MLFIRTIATEGKSANGWRRIVAAVAGLAFALSAVAAAASNAGISVDLHKYGFPTQKMDPYLLGIFYLSADRVAVFFEEPASESDEESHSFHALVFNFQGQNTAKAIFRGNPKAIEITTGPDGGLSVGTPGKVEFYDSKLQPSKTIPLVPPATRIAFDRSRNQLILETTDPQTGHRSAEFLSPQSMERSASLNFPIKARAMFGDDELLYTLLGECSKSAHIVSQDVVWRLAENLPLCDSLTFIGKDKLAYALQDRLYVIDAFGKQVFEARIPVRETFQLPSFVGLSDDHTRLAIVALDKKLFAKGWPYFEQVFVYDLPSERLIFRRALPQTPRAVALSPDGHQLATIEEGVLVLTSVP